MQNYYNELREKLEIGEEFVEKGSCTIVQKREFFYNGFMVVNIFGEKPKHIIIRIC